MPPSNTMATTATSVSSLPYSFTQTDINDAGVNYDVWYKFTAPTNSRVIGGWGFSGNIGTGYRPNAEVYIGPASTPTRIFGPYGNVPFQFPVTPGTEYFIKFQKNLDNAGPNQVQVNFQVAPLDSIATGSILVNDDSRGYPLAALSSTADYTVKNFVKDIVAGESCDILVSGVMAFEDGWNDKVLVYDSSFNTLATITPAITGNYMIRACRGQNNFYFGIDRNPPQIRTISAAGVLSSLTATLTGNTTLLGIAASNDGTVLYFSNRVAASPIKRWNLTTNTAMTDFVAGVSPYRIPDILVLADDTIVALFDPSTSVNLIARRYNSSGTLLNTYDVGAYTLHPAGSFSHLAYAVDNPNSFWIWYHPNLFGDNSLGASRFLNIKVSDGTVLTTRNHAEYEIGGYVSPETATPLARFGNSYSCSFVVMTVDSGGGTPPPSTTVPGGLLYIKASTAIGIGSSTGIGTAPTPLPTLRHDHYHNNTVKKIPNPTVRTALLGD